MRRESAKITTGKTLEEQVVIIERIGRKLIGAPEFEPTPFLIRTLVNIVDIRSKGTCADRFQGCIAVTELIRFPDTVDVNGSTVNVVMGGYRSARGLDVRFSSDEITHRLSMVPGMPIPMVQ